MKSIKAIATGKEEAFTVYEDDKCRAILSDTPTSQGHIILFAKGNAPIIEVVPDEIVGHMFEIANKLSSLVFEKLNAHGTNIIINNGLSAGQELDQFTINIILRWQNDGLNFQWETKKLSEDEMSTATLMISESAKDIGVEKTKKKEVIDESNVKAEKISSQNNNGEENYLIKQLDRVP